VIEHIATGDMLRAAVKLGTKVGLEAAEYMEKGELIPDDIVIRLVAERTSIGIARERGFVLDGFPRNVHQAEMLDEILVPEALDAVVNLKVPTNLVLKRIASRRVCADCGATYSTSKRPRVDWICDNCGGEVVQRDDDTEAAIQRRLDLYEKETKPLIAFYQEHGKLIEISGVGQEEVVSQRLAVAVDKVLSQKTNHVG
jgi:adenylate kinase